MADSRKKLIQQTPNTFQEMNRALSQSKQSPTVSSPFVLDKQFQFPEGLDEKFYYRMDMTPPILRVGWQTDQSANSKDLSFRLNPEYY